MSRIQFVSACALWVGATLVTTSAAHAQYQTQQDYVIRGMSNGSYYGGGSSYRGTYNPAAAYSPAVAPDYSSFYAPRMEYIVPRDAALIDMKVPANATVWFSGEKTQQSGAERSFVTPALETGHNYAYRIKVAWTDADGKKVEREKRVAVRPGSRLNLQFE